MPHDITKKLMSPEEAVRRFISDGSQIALGGFTVSRNNMVLAREIIRQKKRNLHVVCHSHGQALDLLIGAGCVRRLEIAYGGMGRFAPTCIRFRKAVCAGQIDIEDYSNYQMSLRFLAGAMGLPFMATKSGLGTDLVKIEGFPIDVRGTGKVPSMKLAIIENPFNGAEDRVVLLPALTPDVALIHAQYVGEDGTVRLKGLTFADLEQARSAEHVIVTCEEVVPRSFIRDDPDQNSLPAFLVDAVVKAPFGAHPTACYQFYDYDPRHLKLYRNMAANDDLFQEYLENWVFNLPDQEAYLEKVGITDLMRIKASPAVGYAQGLDRR
ncbi:MAG: CoA transferase subunit A [Desulfomonile tiedjei]|uniref:CoA transferase subunit A n=1 Tax=Desulfomonile tiedjei TaxID=2358 RepID=A0A9D6V304_9BACT|nr:CoA transferase subunit A [Desulfomonile tiedjei]